MPIKVHADLRHLDQDEFGEIAYEVMDHVFAIHNKMGRFLDEALLHGEQELEIVHGAGQGILRKAVREFLAERGEVSVFHAAGPEQGGDNVTVVELRH